MNLKKLLEHYEKQFVSKKRDNGDNYVIMTDNRDDALYNAVHEAHGDRLPDDWIYGTFANIIVGLTKYDIKTLDDIENNRHEIVDNMVDIYNHDLTAWLHSNLNNTAYIDEARDEYGTSDKNDIMHDIAMGQYKAIDDIFSHVYALIEANAQNDDE